MNIILKYIGLIALCTHLVACDKKVEFIRVAETSFPAVTPTKDTFSAPRGRYAYSSDGKEVKDIETGLIWQTCQVGQKWDGNTCTGEAKEFTYDEAMALSGRDWRIPTVRELATLIYCSSGKMDDSDDVKDGEELIKNRCSGNYTQPTIDVQAFPNTSASYIWTSSTHAINLDNTWVVNFGYGYIHDDGHTASYGVRLVRVEKVAVSERYVYSMDGQEVKDIDTGLIWQRCQVGMVWNGATCTGEAKAFNFNDAQKQSDNGWRLPTIRELSSLIYCSSGQRKNASDVGDNGASIKNRCHGDYAAPAINTKAFPNTPASFVWSGSPHSNDANRIWFVHFNFGYLGSESSNYSLGVRLVRVENMADNERYMYSVDGKEVKDTKTGLIWQRCQVGMTWNGTTCTGDAKKFNFDSAKWQEGNGWRLPTIRELSSLLYCSSGKMQNVVDVGDGGAPIKNYCNGDRARPTINTKAFPNTPAFYVWSDSPSAHHATYAWNVYFYDGFAIENVRDYAYGVRLVRVEKRFL